MVYICPGGNCTGIAILFFDKVSHLKHPTDHISQKKFGKVKHGDLFFAMISELKVLVDNNSVHQCHFQ